MIKNAEEGNGEGAEHPKGPDQVFYSVKGKESDQSAWDRFRSVMRLLGFEWELRK